jgi:uncharacterized membrane protein YesL
MGARCAAVRRRAGMLNAWEVLGASVMDVRHVGVQLIGCNLLWFFCCLPIITAPPATAALYVITREIGYRHSLSWRDFFSYLGQYFFIGWRWGILNLIAVLIVWLNVWFYDNLAVSIAPLLRYVWIIAGVIWIIIQQYTFPLMLEQEKPRVLLATRNAIVLCLRHPIFTLTYALVAATFIVMTIAVPYFWMIFTVALVMYFYNRGVWYLAQLEKGDEPVL